MTLAPQRRDPRSGSAPKPYVQRKISTLFLRVPLVDWVRVKHGEKTEFRTRQARQLAHAAKTRMPTPVVAYTNWRAYTKAPYEYDCQVMVLEDYHPERLFEVGDIDGALDREGFPTYEHFRRYWLARHGGIFRPDEKVHVWRLRRWRDGDDEAIGALLLVRLYGEFRGDLEPDEL